MTQFTDAYMFIPLRFSVLTLNVPGDCGSSRPTRVEPRLHCVGIECQVRGRCVGSAAHSPLHAIAARALSAARAIEPRSTHFARVRALGAPALITQPAHFAWARALCVGPRTLRGPAHFAWDRALCNPRTWWPMHWYRFACNFQPIRFAIQANHAQYYIKPIPFFNPRTESKPPPLPVDHATNSPKQQP